MSTLLGGTCWAPRALRVNESTITVRAKEVSMVTMAGASESTVSRSRICRLEAELRALRVGQPGHIHVDERLEGACAWA